MKTPEERYNDKDYTLLDLYVNYNTKHKCSCLKCNAIEFISLRDFKHKGSCKNCKYELILKEFETTGCKLISKPSLSTSMEYICDCGSLSTIKWSHFKSGGRCKNCGTKNGKEKNSRKIKIQNNIESYFKEQGCKLLPNQIYINQSQRLNYICSCGTQTTITWKAFKLGCRCLNCAKEKIANRFIPFGKHHFRWNPDREQINLNKKIRNKIKKTLKRTLININKTKTNNTFNTLGYSKEDLIAHIQNHPNWVVVKDLNWELDHHFPIKAFVEHKIYDEKIINALDNLNPITFAENRAKNDKYCLEEFKTWLITKNIII